MILRTSLDTHIRALSRRWARSQVRTTLGSRLILLSEKIPTLFQRKLTSRCLQTSASRALKLCLFLGFIDLFGFGSPGGSQSAATLCTQNKFPLSPTSVLCFQ